MLLLAAMLMEIRTDAPNLKAPVDSDSDAHDDHYDTEHNLLIYVRIYYSLFKHIDHITGNMIGSH